MRRWAPLLGILAGLPCPLVRAAAAPATTEIVLQSGHGANISALAFSDDGHFLVSASEDSTLKLWDPITGGELRTLRGHTNIVTAMAISKDGAHIASASLDHTLRLWNAASGASEAVIRGPQPSVYLLKITPDGSSLVTAETVSAGTLVRVWDIKSGKQTRLIKRDEAAVSHIFFAETQTMLLAEEAGDDDATGSLTSYDLRTGRVLQSRREVLCGASDDGRWIAIDRSTQAARRAVIVDVQNDKPLAALTGQVSRIVFSAGGEWLAYESAAGDTALVQRRSGGAARAIHGRSAEFSMIAISPDGRWLASAGADFSVHIWDVEAGKLAHGISGQYTPTAIAFSTDSKRVAANGGGTDLAGALQIWDIEHRSALAVPKIKHAIAGLAFSKDGAYLAMAGAALDILDARTYRTIRSITCPENDAPVAPVFSPNGRWVAASCAGAISAWSVADGSLAFHFGEHSDAGAAGPIVFSADSRFLAAPSPKGIQVFDVMQRKTAFSLATPDPVSAIAFSPASDFIVCGSHSAAAETAAGTASPPRTALFLLDIRTKRRVWSAMAGASVSAVKFQREGRTLFVLAGDAAHKIGGVIELEAASGKTIRALPVKIPNSMSAAISPNAEWIAVGSNSALRLWRLSYE